MGEHELAAVLLEHGVEPLAASVLLGRLRGRSFGELADDAGLTRQRLQQVERDALHRLGVRKDIVSRIQAEQRAEREALLRQRGRRVTSRELRREVH